ncbi:unnamed protein product [Caenorhabditis bovis]|uniref:Major facilitator superfamily (MFS) profile domain-containing protein n=1 Tax=Caenorhabditis bovis TaxID=2654633 RepID=A0A8S1EXJ2_9PELO|nr:unnamed protein product [Caenorhabditis bovis]
MSFDYKQTDFEIKTEHQNESRFTFCGNTRFVILILGLCCILCTNANLILMNFTVICMQDVIEEQSVHNHTHWLQRSYEISLTFSSAAIGAIFGIIPAVALITSYGIRRTLTSYGLISAIATLFMPLAVSYGLFFVLVVRLLQGIGASILYSSIGTISNKWSAAAGIGTYVAFLSSAFQISNILTMPVSGLLCESSLGWRSIYYIFGSATVSVYLVFYVFYADEPSNHKFVSKIELSRIQEGKLNVNNKKKGEYSAIFKNREVFAITIAIIGASAAVICLNNYGPIYLNKVLGLNIRETGYSNAIPYVFAAVVKFAAGPVTDKLAHISERTSNVIIAQVAYTVSIVLAGLNVVGMVKSAQIVAGELIDLIMAVISMSSWIAAFILPIVIGFVCPDNTHSQWSIFYLGVSLFVVLTNAPFPFMARVKYTKQTNRVSAISEKV